MPGMVGSVLYGSGRKAFNPAVTIAGKTGTCIENGQWVGLFTSYAPLNDPQMAIVVIARGSDGRNHFPAAVAGRIYRALSGRFGKSGDLDVARGRDISAGKTSLSTMETSADDEQDEDLTESADTRDPSSPNVSNTTIWGSKREPASKVRRVLMPINRPRRN
jgi:hypothetical protein